MDRKPIVVQLGEAGKMPHVYRVAGTRVVSNRAIADLEPFRGGDAGATRSTLEALPQPPASAPLLYSDRSWVGGHFALVECRRSAEGYWLDVEGAGVFLVTSEGERIVEVREPVSRANLRPVDAVLGPCLCLALALGGVFCLHASGALFAGGDNTKVAAVALAGLSGAGKSTLAAALDGRRLEGGEGWYRIADDILPAAAGSERALVLPQFPQLKLPPACQWGSDREEELPLAAIVRLAGLAAGEPVGWTRLGGREAAATIIRHTVAGRLFDSDLASAHLDFAGRLAEQVPVYEVGIPRGLETMPEVVAAIERIV